MARLAQRLTALEVDRVHAADWGLHQPLVTLGGRARAARHRESSLALQEAAAARDGADARLHGQVAGLRIAFVLFAPQYAGLPGARERLDGFLARHPPCGQREERIANSAGRPLYVVVVADYASCAAGAGTSATR
jgi:hypothetical protein